MNTGWKSLLPRPWRLLAAGGLVAALAVALLGQLFMIVEQQLREGECRQLLGVARDKAGQIENWLTQRRQEVQALARDPEVQKSLRNYLRSRDPKVGSQLRTLFLDSPAYRHALNIELLDAAGTPLLVAGRTEPYAEAPPAPAEAQLPALVDLHRRPDGSIEFALVITAVPNDAAAGIDPPAYLRLNFDPDKYLYAVIRNWPLASNSGEAGLIRRDGEDVLFLNDLRQRKSSALNLRLPLADPGYTAVQAALAAGEGIYSGRDYRQVATLAAARPVAGTPWLLIAKVDQAEVLSSLNTLRQVSLAVGLTALLFGGLLVWKTWGRRMLLARQALETQLSGIAATAPGVLCSYRLEPGGSACFPYASPAIHELSGLTPAQLAEDAAPFFALVHPDDLEYLQETIRESASALTIWHAEFRIRHPRRGERWIEGRSTPRREADGSILWHGFVHDITNRHQTEQCLRQAETRWRQLAEAMPHLIWIGLPEGRSDYVNSHWKNYTGRGAGQEQCPFWFDMVHAEERDSLARAWNPFLTHEIGCDGEYRLRRSDGEYRWFKVHAVPIHERGGPLKWYVSCTDIQEIKEFEAALRRSLLRQQNLHHDLLKQAVSLELRVAERTAELVRLKNEAEAANQAKTRFLANMSHELRTPLNSLLILAEMLAQNTEANLTPQQVGFARIIRGAGNDLLSLVNDILDLAKIESGRAAVHAGEIGLADLCAWLASGFRQQAENKGLQFVLTQAADLPAAIYSDRDYLRPILRNLLANAVKFTAKGSVRLHIHPAARGWSAGHAVLSRAETVIAFAVRDSGIGIAADKLPLIFEAFEQAESGSNRRYGGTGLGLHVARTNTRLLGGELAVESTPGKGSCFTLYLPLEYAGPAETKVGPAVACPAEMPA